MAMKSNTAPQMTTLSKTATDLNGETAVLTDALRKLLADVFTLYMKTKNFHWHMSGKHFRDYHPAPG
jgi:starvation-inducible DNA-binding protein